LERDAGCALMARMGKRVMPTPAGEYLLHHAEKALCEIAAARATLAQVKDWTGERLRVGASATLCQYVLPPVLREFQESFPRSNLSLYPADTGQALQMFEQDKIDMAFCIEPKADPGLLFEHLFWDELTFLVHQQHPWALAGKVDRSELPRQNIILYTRSSYTYRLIQDYFVND